MSKHRRQINVPKGLTQQPPHESFDPGKTMIQELLAINKNAEPESDVTIDVSKFVQLGDLAKPIEKSADQALDSTRAYTLKKIVGEGGFGEIWESTQNSLGRRIAVKRLRPSLFTDRQNNDHVIKHLLASFRQEVLTTGCLEHPNIVPVYDLGVDENGHPLMVMKFVHGQHWDEAVANDFNRPGGEYYARHIPILINVSQAVAFAHSRGVVHRDIKPSQIMLGEFGEVLLMDWGLALVFDPGKAELQGSLLALSEFTPWSPSVTSPAGTPSYMAPEQTEEAAVDVGPWTDVFLLGGCLYFLLTGYAPHEDKSSEASFRQAVRCKVEPPETRAPDRKIPPELSRICMQALHPDPKARPTAREFIDALQDYLTGASQRREAQELIREATRIANRSNTQYGDYEELGRCTQLIDRALALAPENREAEELRQQVLIQFARRAIENNDFKLARYQAERLEDGPERQVIIEEIDALSQQEKRVRRSLEELYRRASSEYDEIDRARAHAEELIGLMLFNLFKSLEPIGQAHLLASAARRALEHFEAHPERKPTKEHLHYRIASFRAIGDVLGASGEPELALRAYRQAEELLQGFLHHDPQDQVLSNDLNELREKIEAVADAEPAPGPREETLHEFETLKGDILHHLDRLLEL